MLAFLQSECWRDAMPLPRDLHVTAMTLAIWWCIIAFAYWSASVSRQQ